MQEDEGTIVSTRESQSNAQSQSSALCIGMEWWQWRSCSAHEPEGCARPSLPAPPCPVQPRCLQPGSAKKQPHLHGNGETAEKWQLNAAAPHLISTLALTEQIMGNNTPLCCGEMKCFSRRLSCCKDLFVTVPAEISLSFCLFFSVIPSSFPPSPFPVSICSSSSFTSHYFFHSLLPCFSVFLISLLFFLLFLSQNSYSWYWSTQCLKPKSAVKLPVFCPLRLLIFFLA